MSRRRIGIVVHADLWSGWGSRHLCTAPLQISSTGVWSPSAARCMVRMQPDGQGRREVREGGGPIGIWSEFERVHDQWDARSASPDGIGSD
jgi:hypothetical protein